MNSNLIQNCNKLINAFKSGKLGQTIMPEDSHSTFKNIEERLAYFTLPMALNYQRDSYTLWKSALKTFEESKTKEVFNLSFCATNSKEELQKLLTKHKLALQPNKHIQTWQTISQTILEKFGSFEKLFTTCDYDFLKLQKVIQKDFKKGFPYLSGPKIFHYWCFIISHPKYGNISLKNREFIDIAPDTHITKCSILLNVVSQSEAQSLSKQEISNRWRMLLVNSGISPIDMHAPLWFWSRNGFIYKL
jgi:hypothetical protein